MSVAIQTKQEPRKTTLSNTPQSFDWVTIVNQLNAQRDTLNRVGNTNAALLCDNAAKMITRLWVVSSECSSRLSFARNHLAAGKADALENDIIAMAKLLQLSNQPTPSMMQGVHHA